MDIKKNFIEDYMRENPQDVEEGKRFVTGLLIAMPISLALWGLIALLVRDLMHYLQG